MDDNKNNQMTITASNVNWAASEWEKMGRYAKCSNFFLLCDKKGTNQRQITELAQFDPKYSTYRDYFICGKMQIENGR